MMDRQDNVHDHATAPGELGMVHAFLNTCHADGPRERFDSPQRMQDWLAKRALIPPEAPVSPKEFEAVRHFRDTLRALIGADTDLPRAGPRGQFNDLARKALLIVRFDAAGKPGLVPAGSGIPAALARIIAAIVAGEAEGTWSRLKQCRNTECQRVFYDTSKNHSAVWCSSQLCGNRMAARAYRARGHGMRG
jgi:predicted RNA-binding Zn ribbon-like protein